MNAESVPFSFLGYAWAVVCSSQRSIAAMCSLLLLAGFAIWTVWRAKKGGDHRAARLFFGMAHVQGLFFLLASTHEYVEPFMVVGVISVEEYLQIHLLLLRQGVMQLSANLTLNLAMVVWVSISCRTWPKPKGISILGSVAAVMNCILVAYLVLHVITLSQPGS